jgi:hypothetical protein
MGACERRELSDLTRLAVLFVSFLFQRGVPLRAIEILRQGCPAVRIPSSQELPIILQMLKAEVKQKIRAECGTFRWTLGLIPYIGNASESSDDDVCTTSVSN